MINDRTPLNSHLYDFYVRKKMQNIVIEAYIPDSPARHLYNNIRVRFNNPEVVRNAINEFMHAEVS